MLVRKKITIEKYNQIQQDYPDWTYRQIANYFDCSETKIRLFVRDNNLIYNSKKNGLKYTHSFEEIQQYIQEHPSADMREIIEHFHVSYVNIEYLYGWKKLGYKNKR